MKRIPAGLVAVLAVLAAGARPRPATSPRSAATVNGDTISVATLNTQLRRPQTRPRPASACCRCRGPQAVTSATEGTGGPGTYQHELRRRRARQPGRQPAGRPVRGAHGHHLTAADLAAARDDYESTLDGAIKPQAQQASASGAVSRCAGRRRARASPASELLAGLPASVRTTEIANQAVDEQLLARGADLSDAAVLDYYDANRRSVHHRLRERDRHRHQATADTVVNKLNAGAVVRQRWPRPTRSTPRRRPTGGPARVQLHPGQVLQALQVSSVTVGQPVAPVQDRAAATWDDLRGDQPDRAPARPRPRVASARRCCRRRPTASG